MNSSKPKRLNFSDIKERLTAFLLNFEDPELSPEPEECYARLGKLKYRIMLVPPPPLSKRSPTKN